MDRQECEARVGSTLRKKWKLERLIGLGGMAAVYEATHKIGRSAAIKVLHPEIALEEKVRERFEQEALAVNSVGHPGVIEIIDVDETEDGSPFLVMELLDGETLADRVERSPDMPLDALLRIVDQVLDALTACHKKGIIHRDIKPENLFLLTNGKVKLLDFGIARVRAGVRTQAGTMLGTVAFMPPEQLKGSPIDSRADLFAVGATMFTVLAGRRVHLAKDDTQLAMLMLSKPAPLLKTVASNLDDRTCMVVDRALAYLPERRYPDTQTMRGDVWALQKKQRPPYAFACVSAKLDPNVVELPAENAPKKAQKATKPEGKGASNRPPRMVPRTDPQMPAFKPGGGPVPSTDPQLPAFLDASKLPPTENEIPAFAGARDDSEAPPASETPQSATPPSTGPESAVPDDVAISEKAPSDDEEGGRPEMTTDKSWPAVDEDEVKAAASETPADSEPPPSDLPESDLPESEAPASEAPESEAPGSEAPESEAPESEAPEVDDEDDEGVDDDGPVSDPVPSEPPLPPPPEEDALQVAREEEGGNRWILVFLVVVAVAVAAWYTGVIPGFGPPKGGKPAPTGAATAPAPTAPAK